MDHYGNGDYTMTRAFQVLSIAVLSALAVAAQAPTPTPSDDSPQFEVASIKPNKSGTNFIRMSVPPSGGFNATNTTVRELVRSAYGVQDYQVVGLPSWASTDRFDIAATSAPGTGPAGPPVPGGPPTRFQLMLRHLLADRFKLAVRREMREMPIYHLTLARSDGKTGPQLTPSTTDCAALFGRGARPGGPPPLGAGQRPPCGIMRAPGMFMAGAMGMAQLTASLGDAVGRPVVDRTGLTGNFDVELRFTPDQLPQAGALPPGAPAPPPIDPNGPTIFTALQEQLGLKLENARGRVEMLVIESVAPPTPD